jgi:Tudor domain
MSFMKDVVDVYFVDYGNKASLPLKTDVKPIVNVSITELQTIAIPCSLRGVSVGIEWTEKETSKLHEMLDEELFDVCNIFKFQDLFNFNNMSLCVGECLWNLE